ncbi:MAG: D-alanine--D-alanine ligase [Candidatus Moranbacteria bacterium]|nr:D-alanine--D-alanine ligase [Candidatus Moranbacteria bacterium]
MIDQKKIRVGILFGGKSAEHEVSLRSAKSILDALDRDRYEPVLIGIAKDGKWQSVDEKLLPPGESLAIGSTSTETALVPSSEGELTGTAAAGHIDVVFPVLHGPFGEDGTVQGLLRLANVPFVGPGVLGSAVGMDKDVMKRLLRDAGISNANFLVFRSHERIPFEAVRNTLGLPVFVKPANLGSSVGVSKASDEESFIAAVEEAFRYDTKIIVEESIVGREIECAVLGNEHPIASVPGEVIPHAEFYSYEAKYIDADGAGFEIPARLDPETMSRIQDIAIRTFRTLSCEGMGRVDCFLRADGEVLVNEINTIPGFTSISMYPKLWEASGIGYAELIDRLIRLAIDRHERDGKLLTSR